MKLSLYNVEKQAAGHSVYLRKLLHIFPLAAAIGWAFQAPAAAQQTGQDSPGTPADSSQAPGGHIIFARDVSFGSAIGPRTPGRVHTVNAGPTDLILASLTSGLEAIGDDESANIIAGTDAQTSLLGGQIGLGLDGLPNMAGSGPAAANIGDIQSTATGRAIGQATGAIGNAMGTVRGVLGNLPGGRP